MSTLPYVSNNLTIDTASSSKRLRLNEKSSILWHKCLGHISKHIMVRLINDEILLDFDFSYFDICVDCIKGKMTTKIMNDKADKMHRYASLSLHPFVFSFLMSPEFFFHVNYH